MRRIGWMLGLVLIGCGEEPKTDGACTELLGGDWTFGGTAVGMEMGAVVTVDAAACSFTLSDWDMVMGTVPDGGTLEGDQVTLSGDAPWPTCTGSAGPDGDSASGACEDGSTWSMTMTTTM